jgi:hypothetical protein
MPVAFTARPHWGDAPSSLVAAVERALGSRIVAAEPVVGGMSPAPAAVVGLHDGRTAFVKAVAASVNPRSHELYRGECDVLGRLPVTVPHAPLLALVESGDWVAVVTQAATGGALGPPWRSQDVGAAADAVDVSAAHVAPAGLGRVVDRLPDLDGWRDLAQRDLDAGPTLEPWEAVRIERLVAMSEGWRTWTAGERLVHLDVRCDNLVRDGDDVWLVDWASAAAGAAWIDGALLALDVVGSGHVGGTRVAVDMASGLLRRMPYEATRFVVAWAGMLRRNSLHPGPPGLPTFRGRQRERAATLRPLVERLVSR